LSSRDAPSLSKLPEAQEQPPRDHLLSHPEKGEFILTTTQVRFLALAGSVLMASFVFAQQSTQSSADSNQVTAQQVDEANIQLMRQDIRSERKKIVAANLPLTETEATKFWPLYDRYIGETIKINDGRYALIKEYAQNYQSMTDDQADSFIKRWLGFDQDNTALRMKYIPEFEKVISRKKTAMFFQMDRRLSMVVELKLASQVPLVQP
jgi:hypothetical protein